MTSDPALASPAESRLEHIDLVRGYALLGVLLMNIQFWFRAPIERYTLNPHPFPGWWNTATDMVLGVWFAGKSVTLFSILFAIGLCMQRDSILARGGRWLPFGLRRLAVAMGLGILHVTLLWMGDILHQYALSALLILPFLKREPRTLTRWLLGVFTFAALAMVIFSVIRVLKGPAGFGPDPAQLARARGMVETLVQGYTQPSWWAVARTRLFHYRSAMAGLLVILALFTWVNFMVGVRIWKSGILQDPVPHLDRLGRWARIGILGGVLLCTPAEIATWLTGPLKSHWGWAWLAIPLVGLSQAFGALVLALGLLSGLVWLWHQPRWRPRLRPLTAVGRMGFTNYITQSVVCTWIFHGFGLGLYNRVGPLAGAMIGLTLFTLQIPLSLWWLRHFRFGPLEWVWRSLAYGRAPAFRRAAVGSRS
jgi:uncharacterized protein